MNLLLRERLHVMLDGDPLSQLAQRGAGQFPNQLRLTREHDLHQRGGVRFEVRKQADLFEGHRVEILGRKGGAQARVGIAYLIRLNRKSVSPTWI